MNDAAAISGSYADFKLIKSRSQAQIVIEIPIEQAERFLKVFGIPQPGQEKPVALALLNTKRAEPEEKPRRKFDDMPRSQQAGLMCATPEFQQWMDCEGTDYTAERLRSALRIQSRAELDTNERAAKEWDGMMTRFRQGTGREAELRG